MSEAVAAKAPVNNLQLAPGKENFNQFEFHALRYSALIPHGVTLEQILVPGFWAHHAKDLRPGDEIRARAEDGSWMAELYIIEASRTSVIVQVLHKHDLKRPVASKKAIDEFIALHEIRWANPTYKHRVVRLGDGAILNQGFEQKIDAETWLRKHAQDTVGAPSIEKK